MGDVVQDVELHPGEEIPLQANFQAVLATGESVVSAVIEAVDEATGATVSGILSGSFLVISPRVQQEVAVGTGVIVGRDYRLTITGVTDQDHKYDQRFLVQVRSRAVVQPSAAWTIDDLRSVKLALIKGERTVSFADRSVTYRDVEELLRVKAEIEAELTAASTRPRQWAAHSSKGLI